LTGESQTGGGKPFLYVQTVEQEMEGRFSPDGQWIAYQSNQPLPQICVIPFRAQGPPLGGKRQISTAGGRLAQWRRDGKEIFYVGLDGMLMSVDVTSNGETLEAGGVRTISNGSYRDVHPYDVSADGQRILAVTAQTTTANLTILQNWTAALRK
jgi:Tol biopolymer transport system component